MEAWVGGLVAAQAYPDGTWIYCSGTLISPTVFLTAAHCAEGARVRVSFSSAYQDGDKTYAGTWHADPAYNQSQSDPHDIAVVVFDKAIKGITPARLPASGSLSPPPPERSRTARRTATAIRTWAAWWPRRRTRTGPGSTAPAP